MGGEKGLRGGRGRNCFFGKGEILCQSFTKKKLDFHFGAVPCFKRELDGIVFKRGEKILTNEMFHSSLRTLGSGKGSFH